MPRSYIAAPESARKVEVVKKEKKKTRSGSVASSLEEVFGADVRPMDE